MIFPENELLPGNALEVMPHLPDESMDLIFADPPYNLQLGGDLWRPDLTKVDAVNDAWDKFDSFAAYDEFTRLWLQEARRLLKDRGSIWVSGTYHNIFRVGSIMQDLGFWILNTITWMKPNAMPNFNGTRLKNDVEFVIWAKKSANATYTFNYQPAKAFNDFSAGKQLGSVWLIPSCGGAERLKADDGQKLHSTQKPEALLRRIILISSQPGDMVFDPFMGTGTTAAVAKKLRRRYVGIERDERYYHAAVKRLANIQPIYANHPDLTVKTKAKRVRFASLIEKGLLRAGQTLYLDKPAAEAILLPDGRLQSGDRIGSIHGLGRQLKQVPTCNGWKHWYFEDEHGQRLPVDVLRRNG